MDWLNSELLSYLLTSEAAAVCLILIADFLYSRVLKISRMWF